ncbi:hypothetical protein HanRHA438_Chr10g0463721 [Helianthus annuus]|nr:hypothetical protein HanRHA438_Chr10g0463721 [Helianthus annuus]
MNDLENLTHEPMAWVGIYIAIASLLCDIAMAADLVHGFRNKRLWFPSKNFTLNAASIAVITIAMKLPVDLSTDMLQQIDEEAKLGSLAFMCTMMANFMPSLAAMDNKTLLVNIIVIAIFGVYCWNWKSRKVGLVTPTVVSRTDNTDGNLRSYILKVHDEVELGEKTLTQISNSVSSFILKAEKEQNKDLLELLEKSTGFKGVETFDTDQVQTQLSVELVNSWSLPIVTLTCIAVALPNIPKDTIKSLLRSVGEGLSYTHQVEESLNSEKEYVNIRKATIILWNEVEHKCMWLDKALQKDDFRNKTAKEILKWFSDRAKEIVREIKEGIRGEMVENPPKELIAANSMYRIAETIFLRDDNTEPITKKQLFTLLSGVIADILCACFTNIPRVITVKCNESVIEKREASVKAAAKLLGKTSKIIERLETCELPSMDPDKMAYVDEWRLYLKQSIP